MKTKHTPGPWQFRSMPPRKYYVFADPINYYGDIALVNQYSENSEEHAKANAKLIAAAPELLEVCIALVDHMQSMRKYVAENSNLRGVIIEEVAAAKMWEGEKAIKKATE